MLFIIFPDVHLKILGDAMDEEKFKGAPKGSMRLKIGKEDVH